MTIIELTISSSPHTTSTPSIAPITILTELQPRFGYSWSPLTEIRAEKEVELCGGDSGEEKEKVEEAFSRHEKRYKEDKDKIQRWRNALTQVANIKGWHLNGRESNKLLNLSVDAFTEMKKLRLLKVLCLTNCDDINYLSNELRLLDWKECPLRFLPSSFQPDNLVALLLSYSRIEQLWKEARPLYKLKVINLEGSQNLIKTPDFTMAPGCKSLRNLPSKIGMESLETFILSCCSDLQRFPEIDGKMECLLKLYLNGTSIEELPSSIGKLSSLVLLNLEDCHNLVSLPSTIGGCTSLKSLNLSGCYKVENLPENLLQVEFLEELELSEATISFNFQSKNLKVVSFSGCKGPSCKLQENSASPFHVKQRRTNSMPLMFPWLLSLSSLTTLKLRDCNLGEGDVPSDISCLSSLTELDLSGNNFISITSSLTQLSKLDRLKLSNCKELKSLPELPASIEIVDIHNCASLELVAIPSKVCNSADRAWIRGTHCYRLADNVIAFTFVKRYLKVFSNSRKFFGIMIPGNEIPEWFSHQRVDSSVKWFGHNRVESSIKIPLPLNFRNDSKWMGVAFCCIFTNDDAISEEDLRCSVVTHHINSGKVSCGGSVFLDRNSCRLNWCGWSLGKEYNQPIKKDHLFLRYWRRDKLYPFSFEDKCDKNETENLSTSGCSNQERYELELSILSCVRGKVQNEEMNEDSAADGSTANAALESEKVISMRGWRQCHNQKEWISHSLF
ncbi:hypothetical protein V6N12_023500 [Hibiscus sabdariffa]|uniref:Disease resistance protein RPS4B/Roq1-like leucine-rich repeats domain-containing protein n=1 Tax=Hibiscus sabdariffa TaxID=183260 RepID=A0ABR2FYG5_9ROSI